MNTITRVIKMYTYRFANIDIISGKAENITTITRATPMGSREIAKYCKDHNDAVKIQTAEELVKYSLPVEMFVNACQQYAQLVASGQATAITDDDGDENSEE